MARSGLSARLGRIRETQKNAGRAESVTVAKAGSDRAVETGAAIPGWHEIAPCLFEREATFDIAEYRPSFSPHLPLLFPREREGLMAFTGNRNLIESLVFFDLETTGLSHGAGTIAFMAGIARFAGEGRLSVLQLLASDYPGETAFLDRFSSAICADSVLVSYNGKCFDAQILQTRYLMNARKPPFMQGPMPHLDLLFPARRLWKAELGSCRMTDIESGILGRQRIDDLPGSEAPDAWFDFLKTGSADRLLAVGDHNREDTASLARILFALDGAIDSGRGRASLIRALDFRSRGDYESSSRFLEPLAASGDPTAARLLAIDSEHRLGDLPRALELASSIGDENRVARITRKISAQGGVSL